MHKTGTLAIVSLSFCLLVIEKTAWAAIVLDFSTLTQNDALAHDIGPVYSANGFVLTATHLPTVGNPPTFSYFGTQSDLFPGATALFHHVSLGEITLTRADGGAFDFYSIGLAELPPRDEFGNVVNSGPFDITFYATRVNGAAVSDTVTVDNFLTINTYGVNGLHDVVEVHWFQGAGGSNIPPDPTHQFSDITVASVPEPSSLIGFCGLSLIGLCTHRRRPQPNAPKNHRARYNY